MIYHDCLIVGGGASGIIAALVAKDLGKDVAIIEGTDRIGKKILTTGNGRCNISNVNIVSPFSNYNSENNNFFNYCLENFSVENTKNLFLNFRTSNNRVRKGKIIS